MPTYAKIHGNATLNQNQETRQLGGGVGNQVGFASLPAMDDNYWAYRAHAHVGNDGVNDANPATLTFAVYEQLSSGSNPRLGLTYNTSSLAYNGLGASVEVDFIAGVPLAKGRRYIPAIAAFGRVVNVFGSSGYRQASPGVIGAEWWRQTVANPPPSSTFQPSGITPITTDVIFAQNLYLLLERNAAPSAATGLLPAAGATVTSLTPAFSFDFNDPNEDVGDTISAATVYVERVSDGQQMWQGNQEATPAEQVAGRMTMTYAGTPLVRGVQYRWRVATFDHFGANSSTLFQTFTVALAGQISLDTTTPPAKIDPTTGNTFTARWQHVDNLGLSKVRAKLFVGGKLAWAGAAAGFTPTGAPIAASADPGTAFTFTQTQAGMPTLTRGVTYSLTVEGQDTNGVWSPAGGRLLRINAPPDRPANLQPNTAEATSSRPKLVFFASDPDIRAGYAETLTGTVTLKTSAGATRFTRAATLVDAETGRWEYQLTATDEPDLATGTSVSRLWSAQVNDGSFNGYSSENAVYVFAEGPDVTITSPAADGDVVTVATPVFAWDVVGAQQSRQVQLYDESGTVIRSVSGASTIKTLQPGIGWLYNQTTYGVAVLVDDGTVTGISPIRWFTTNFPGPPALALFANPTAGLGEPIATIVDLVWDASQQPPTDFVGYRITRRIAGSPIATATLLAAIDNVGQLGLTDPHPPLNTDLIYALQQVTRDVNGDLLLGDMAEQIVRLNAHEFSAVIVSMTDPTLRAFLTWRTKRPRQRRKSEQITFQPWSGGDPVVFDLGGRELEVSATFALVDDSTAISSRPPQDILADLEAIWEGGHPVSYRDPRRRVFGVMELDDEDQYRDDSDVDIDIRRTAVVEGVPS